MGTCRYLYLNLILILLHNEHRTELRVRCFLSPAVCGIRHSPLSACVEVVTPSHEQRSNRKSTVQHVVTTPSSTPSSTQTLVISTLANRRADLSAVGVLDHSGSRGDEQTTSVRVFTTESARTTVHTSTTTTTTTIATTPTAVTYSSSRGMTTAKTTAKTTTAKTTAKTTAVNDYVTRSEDIRKRATTAKQANTYATTYAATDDADVDTDADVDADVDDATRDTIRTQHHHLHRTEYASEDYQPEHHSCVSGKFIS